MQDFDTLIAPDLFHWQQLQAQLDAADIQDPGFLLNLQKLVLGSNYATSQLAKYPELITSLASVRTFALDEEMLRSAVQDVDDIDIIKLQLRRFRHRKLVEIIYLDICLGVPVRQILEHLTALADLLIAVALERATAILANKHGTPLDQHGEPMQLNVIGMGKLGGGELNFSSDIDIICTYADDGQLKGFGQLSHNQYFSNVVKLFTSLLHDRTVDGFVYRVDLRLRPWGDSGPMVFSHHSFEHYYQLHGREWEQYAMVKARVITGSASDKEHLNSILKPFIYRRYHDYRVFDGLAQMKRKIDQQARKKRQRQNIKTGRGGIREIEFFIQAFQILKGGRNHQLQTPSLYRAMEALAQRDITELATLDMMRRAYDFLRLLENRIQMLNDEQTHEIPAKSNYLDRIAYLTGYPDWSSLDKQLQSHLTQVNRVFATLFTREDNQSDQAHRTIRLDELEPEEHLAFITAMGFADPDEVNARLLEFYTSKALLFMSDKAKQRFRCFFPELLKLVVSADQPMDLLEKLLSLMSSIAGRSVYFELLYQNIPLLTKLVDLFAHSNWIATEVTQHPMLIESLLYPEALAKRFDKERQTRELRVQLDNVEGDEELELDILRQYKREQTIEIATAEIAGEINAVDVSHYLSELAEILLQAVYDLSYRQLVTEYGSPACVDDDGERVPGMGIIAYGKLGGNELHYESDLDIIFLHNSEGNKQQTRGDAKGNRIIDNATFFARLAQKVISKVTLLTAGGKLYEIDTRLRPDGASGLLVSSLSGYRQYQLDKAWVWEHQAIIRARFIAGDRGIIKQFESIRGEVLLQQRDADALADEIQSMRERMYEARNPPEGAQVNLKHSRGCMVDVEFMVQYLVLLYANKFASLTQTTDNIGLINELSELGLVDRDFRQLASIYQTFHEWLHRRVLQNQPDEIDAASIQSDIDTVKNHWNRLFGNTGKRGE